MTELRSMAGDRSGRKHFLIAVGVLTALAVWLLAGLNQVQAGPATREGRTAETGQAARIDGASEMARAAETGGAAETGQTARAGRTEGVSETDLAAGTVPELPDIYNVLLVGVDRRDDSWYGNSDSMILASINRKKERITLMSFMRDLYADIPDHGVHKLNAACAYGGCDLLVKTLEKNYQVRIDNYVWVDFQSMSDVIDALGGVDLTLSDAEAESANGSIAEICGIKGLDPASEYFQGGGDLHCDGIQAVAYGRIRYIGNADYQRTERQRLVMEQVISKAKDLSLGGLAAFAADALPLLHHDMPVETLLAFTAAAPSFLKYEVKESRVPFDDHFHSEGEILHPDMDYTLPQIQRDLYD